VWESLTKLQKERIVRELRVVLASIRSHFRFTSIGNFVTGDQSPTAPPAVGHLIAFEWKKHSSSTTTVGPLQTTSQLLAQLMDRHLAQMELKSDPMARFLEFNAVLIIY